MAASPRLSLLFTAFATAFGALACSAGYGGASGTTGGPGGSTATASGVDDSRRVAAASSSERGQLCDWWAGLSGGYGGSITKCNGSGRIFAAKSQAECVGRLSAIPPSCGATVGEFQACVVALTARCAGGLPSECAELADASCGPFIRTTTTVEESDGGSTDGGSTNDCSSSSQCVNGACTCTDGPNAKRTCCSDDKCGPTDPTSCSVLCKVCN